MAHSIAQYDERTHTFERASASTLESMRSSLAFIKTALSPVLEKLVTNEAVAKYAAYSNRLQEQLTPNDYMVLATALRANIVGKSFSYSDIQDLVWEMNGKTMNTQSIYNSLRRLVNNNLIRETSDDKASAQSFEITSYGSDVLALSLINEEVRYEALLAK